MPSPWTCATALECASVLPAVVAVTSQRMARSVACGRVTLRRYPLACPRATGNVEAILQMPRGNLEAVRPRALVLPAVAAALDAGEFAGAPGGLYCEFSCCPPRWRHLAPGVCNTLGAYRAQLLCLLYPSQQRQRIKQCKHWIAARPPEQILYQRVVCSAHAVPLRSCLGAGHDKPPRPECAGGLLLAPLPGPGRRLCGAGTQQGEAGGARGGCWGFLGT